MAPGTTATCGRERPCPRKRTEPLPTGFRIAGKNPLLCRNPSVLSVTGRRPEFLVGLFHSLNVVTRHRVSLRLRIDTIDARAIQSEDLRFHLSRKRFISKLL